MAVGWRSLAAGRTWGTSMWVRRTAAGAWRPGWSGRRRIGCAWPGWSGCWTMPGRSRRTAWRCCAGSASASSPAPRGAGRPSQPVSGDVEGGGDPALPNGYPRAGGVGRGGPPPRQLEQVEAGIGGQRLAGGGDHARPPGGGRGASGRDPLGLALLQDVRHQRDDSLGRLIVIATPSLRDQQPLLQVEPWGGERRSLGQPWLAAPDAGQQVLREMDRRAGVPSLSGVREPLLVAGAREVGDGRVEQRLATAGTAPEAAAADEDDHETDALLRRRPRGRVRAALDVAHLEIGGLRQNGLRQHRHLPSEHRCSSAAGTLRGMVEAVPDSREDAR